jgi:hypothetical protein
LKVGRVVVRVRAAVLIPEGRERVTGSRCRAAALEASGGRAVADEIDDLLPDGARAAQCFGRVQEGDLACVGCESDVAGSVRRRQVLTAGRTGTSSPGRLLNQKMLTRRQRDVWQRRHLPSRPTGRRVLNRPVVQLRVVPAPVENLDEVILIRRAAVAAAAEDLTDDDQRCRPRRRLWRRRGCRRGHGRRLRRRQRSRRRSGRRCRGGRRSRGRCWRWRW